MCNENKKKGDLTNMFFLLPTSASLRKCFGALLLSLLSRWVAANDDMMSFKFYQIALLLILMQISNFEN